MIDTEKVGHIKGPEIRSRNDFAMWLQILKKGISADGMNVSTAIYRQTSNSLTSSRNKAMFDLWTVYRKIEKLNVLRSAVSFISYIFHAVMKRIL
jgi:teichuronic acid biosynthesis glycosyltransferase TuaG